MRRWLIGGALAAVAVLAMVAWHTQEAAADPRDFTLINSSSIVIIDVFVSPSDVGDWGEDILGRDVLTPGDSVFISFSRFDPASCLYDIRVVGETGQEGLLYQVDLCATDTVTFYDP